MSLVLNCPNCHEDVSLPDADFSALMCPHCLAEFTIKPVLHGANLADDDSPASGYASDEGMTNGQAGGFVIHDEPDDEADDQEVYVGGYAEDEADASPGETQAAPSSAPARAPKRRKKRGPSVKAHLVGIVGGGVLGLSIGYYLLNWIGGPQFNFLDIPLPGIEHTQRGAKDDGGNGGDGGQRPIERRPMDERPANGRPGGGSVVPSPPDGPRPPSDPRPMGNPRPEPPERREPTFYSAAEIGAAAALATQALERAPGAVSADAYRRLCRLAEMVTFADPHDDGVPAKQGEVILALQTATRGGNRAETIGTQGAARLAEENRVGEGVLLTGTVQSADRRGEYHLLRLTFLGGDAKTTVVSRSPAGFKPGDKVLIAGVVVDSPGTQFPQVQWDEPRVVLGGMPLRLP
jgi:hypothetical protein